MNMEQKVLLIALILFVCRFIFRILYKNIKHKDNEFMKKIVVELLDWIRTALSALWIAFVVMYFVLQAFKIPSGSMMNTLLIKDHLFVSKYAYGVRLPAIAINKEKGIKIGDNKYLSLNMKRFFVKNEPQRRDIVIFAFPLDTSKDFVKRCIGIPGDKIEIKNKVLYVNDVEQIEPYVIHLDDILYPKEMPFLPDDLSKRDNFGPVIVPENHLFVMGDNRDQSYDSRFWGFLHKDYIKGKALFKFWPVKRIGLLK